MTQTDRMGNDEKYLSLGGVLGMLGAAILDRFACVRKGHDPFAASGTFLCRRCLNRVR